ncbi:hypothetical protein F5Y00DRAFT_138110 [Daldinia vernicosa]|uniref:uncharacterized protein n=1 Tax=Daldinia vernicosa TaxID=114800 RepID=UPI00200720ED|nr:uncharacterized protein F5Y00DRAFT_138110 [Daldinia vernicosa]KAI0846825.1 hypothetical protein F5Y00DRAFT_138110 [Daldinia vernicosa]
MIDQGLFCAGTSHPHLSHLNLPPLRSSRNAIKLSFSPAQKSVGPHEAGARSFTIVSPSFFSFFVALMSHFLSCRTLRRNTDSCSVASVSSDLTVSSLRSPPNAALRSLRTFLAFLSGDTNLTMSSTRHQPQPSPPSRMLGPVAAGMRTLFFFVLPAVCSVVADIRGHGLTQLFHKQANPPPRCLDIVVPSVNFVAYGSLPRNRYLPKILNSS